MGDNKVCIIVTILVVITIILMAVLIPLTYSSLEPTEIGLAYNKNSIELDETKLYSNGRHAIGVTTYFISYSTELQTNKFEDVNCRTKDGLNILITAAYQYRIKNDLQEVISLFHSFPWNTELDAYTKMSRDVFRNVASKFTAFEYVVNRTDIEALLRIENQAQLDKFGAIIENFQLINIEFPYEFQDAIEQAQNAQLLIASTLQNQTKAISEGLGQINRAVIDSEVIYNQAVIEATNIKQNALSLNATIANRISQSTSSLINLQNQLGLKAEDIITYLWGKSIIEISEHQKIPIKYKAPLTIQCFLDASVPCPV